MQGQYLFALGVERRDASGQCFFGHSCATELLYQLYRLVSVLGQYRRAVMVALVRGEYYILLPVVGVCVGVLLNIFHLALCSSSLSV